MTGVTSPDTQRPVAIDTSVPRLRIGLTPNHGSTSTVNSAGSAALSDEQRSAVIASDGQMRADVRAFIQQLATNRGLSASELNGALADARYNPTVARLVAPPIPGSKASRSWMTYRARMVDPKRIDWGITFWQNNANTLAQATQRFGVPASIIVAIIGVETLYGRHMGNFRVLDALSTLAFDYPDPSKPHRAQMFQSQLADFLTLMLQGKLELKTLGSYAGAIGMPQFMPSSIMRYAIDGDANGHIDLINNPRDIILSVGNFLMQHGWERGLPIFAPVTLPRNAARLVEGGLAPTWTWPQLQAAGATATTTTATFAPSMTGNREWRQGMLGVINLPEESLGTAEYRTATVNFFALAQYNRSYFYAASVADLAAAIQAKIRAVSARSVQLNTPVEK
jgi:membrane-bound lytic murein transglycosylase B